MLKDTPCSMKVFDVLRQMNAVRQIEAADLMIGQHNFTLMFARATRAATPHSQLVAAKKMTGAAASTPPGQQNARMERELTALQTRVKSVEETYGIDNLHLTVARGYVAKLLATLASPGGFRITAKNILGSFRKSLRSILSRRPWTRKVPYGAETWPTGITKCSRLVRPGSHNVQREHLIAASRYAPFPAEQFAGGGVCCPWGGAHSTAATVFTGQAAYQLAPALLAPAPTVPMVVVILDLLNCYNRVGELELGGCVVYGLRSTRFKNPASVG
ncbi:RepB plasmid partitioning protein [Sinorhizobium medicae]|uniref:plasmid partitioning protein RepB C-terminal domain-containing protein n=1 Tax=Sinorhizobium medicae TaxID=110321 RepID=UPI0011ADCB20|nr:plasmid partitioning protein RepB C-terminal domain-containing protein [Sinorhizobium medicae]TWA26185.1 RepB plasmid partitioning protein [Sinorhizobium medicae]